MYAKLDKHSVVKMSSSKAFWKTILTISVWRLADPHLWHLITLETKYQMVCGIWVEGNKSSSWPSQPLGRNLGFPSIECLRPSRLIALTGIGDIGYFYLHVLLSPCSSCASCNERIANSMSHCFCANRSFSLHFGNTANLAHCYRILFSSWKLLFDSKKFTMLSWFVQKISLPWKMGFSILP